MTRLYVRYAVQATQSNEEHFPVALHATREDAEGALALARIEYLRAEKENAAWWTALCEKRAQGLSDEAAEAALGPEPIRRDMPSAYVSWLPVIAWPAATDTPPSDSRPLIISRHPGAVAWAREHSPWSGEEHVVVAEVAAQDVQDRRVIGNLPMRLAACCREFWAIEFAGPPPRGQEYGVEAMAAAGAALFRYIVLPVGRTEAARRADFPALTGAG